MTFFDDLFGARRRHVTLTPEQVAEQSGSSVQAWRRARDVLGVHWPVAWETVAHLSVRGDLEPDVVARILVGGHGYPGLLHDMSQP